MGFDQYHEPPDELPAHTRAFARMCASLTEEAEAIGWYEQRLAVEPDPDAVAVMRNAQTEEFKHFAMDLEFLLRRTPVWRDIAHGILFQEGDIVEATFQRGHIVLKPQIVIDRSALPNADDEYTPAQRRFINARLAKADEDIKKGRTYGPFNTADEMIASMEKELKKRAAAKRKAKRSR